MGVLGVGVRVPRTSTLEPLFAGVPVSDQQIGSFARPITPLRSHSVCCGLMRADMRYPSGRELCNFAH